MSETVLVAAVQQFCRVTQSAQDNDLDRAWAWGAYDEEGVRFACFRTYEELRELAVSVAVERARAGMLPTSAQRILAQYHTAYRDLQALLVGSVGVAEQEPQAGEWPLRRVVQHIVQADAGFYVVVRAALDSYRRGDAQQQEITQALREELIGVEGQRYEALLAGPLPELLDFFDTFHQRVLDEFETISDAELEVPSQYWEGYDLPVRFRLHRFESHLRQHTIQIVKTLRGVGVPALEIEQIRRMLFGALAEVEGASLGSDMTHNSERSLAATIATRADEVAVILGSTARI